MKLLDVLKGLEAAGTGDRLPVLTSDQKPRHVIHRSTIDRFIAKSATAGATKDELENLTLEDLLADPDLKDMLATTVAVVPEAATLADAKRAMEALKWCQDVMITPAGSSTEPASGWVTNVIIASSSQVDLPFTKMIPLAAAHVTREQPDKLKLVDALAAMDKSKKGDRLPVLTADDQPLYVIHRSTVDTFIAQSALGDKSADDLKKLTLADLLADPFLGRQLESSFAVVPGTARKLMPSGRWNQFAGARTCWSPARASALSPSSDGSPM